MSKPSKRPDKDDDIKKPHEDRDNWLPEEEPEEWDEIWSEFGAISKGEIR